MYKAFHPSPSSSAIKSIHDKSRMRYSRDNTSRGLLLHISLLLQISELRIRSEPCQTLTNTALLTYSRTTPTMTIATVVIEPAGLKIRSQYCLSQGCM